MKTNIYVLTTRRSTDDPYEYLRSTISQIDAQGANDYCTIVSDGEYHGPRFDGWDVLEYRGKIEKGNRDAWFFLFEQAATLRGDALCFEDDVDLCSGALRRMLDFHIPSDVSAVRFFTPRVTSVSTNPGLHRLPPNCDKKSGALFLQCLKFTHEALVALDGFRTSPAFRISHEADLVVGRACNDLGLVIAQHKPDLAQHVGEVSAAHASKSIPWWKKSQAWEAELAIHTLDESAFQ